MANELIEALAGAGINFVAAFPSSSLSSTEKLIEADSRFRCVFPSNEGEGVAICGGAWMAGKRPALIMENSGLSMIAYQVIRLNAAFEVPLLLVLDYRGDLGDGNWWAVPFGWTTPPLLDALRIPYTIAERKEELTDKVDRLARTAFHSKYPAALVLRYGMELE
ncbi:MAG: sulfopyruvate decarboxylase [Proteobacteria bacterium]|nr:MAG: sulfopyruvate decarboxylase [Pseudomonadota bacterium]